MQLAVAAGAECGRQTAADADRHWRTGCGRTELPRPAVPGCHRLPQHQRQTRSLGLSGVQASADRCSPFKTNQAFHVRDFPTPHLANRGPSPTSRARFASARSYRKPPRLRSAPARGRQALRGGPHTAARAPPAERPASPPRTRQPQAPELRAAVRRGRDPARGPPGRPYLPPPPPPRSRCGPAPPAGSASPALTSARRAAPAGPRPAAAGTQCRTDTAWRRGGAGGPCPGQFPYPGSVPVPHRTKTLRLCFLIYLLWNDDKGAIADLAPWKHNEDSKCFLQALHSRPEGAAP